ncbi:MAG: phenylacetate--CoA ligase [Peptococcaceae bacterium]|nr:phenylacetate--CoA ligase [Peptococcaceae bacterium]
MWQEKIETMPRKELEALQLQRLKWSVGRAYAHVPYYRAKMEKQGIVPEKIKQLSDLCYLPYTTKADLQQCYPYGSFAVPRKELVRIQGSSGTTGKPTLVGYTRQDLENWRDMVARVIMAAGVNSDDVAQIAFGYGLFTGALGLHQGLERIGALVVPLSSGNTERQLMLMEDLQVSVLVSTPSYAYYLAELIEERGLKERLNLRIGLFGSEGCSLEMRNSIEKRTGIFVTDNYGMSELIGPGVAGECHLRQGLHVAEDHFIPEVISTKNQGPVEDGKVGELVMTSLTKEAMPVIRYRTGDLTRLHMEPCACGRTHARIEKLKGRLDDMIIIKGVNVFPGQIEYAIRGVEGLSPQYMLIAYRDGVMDALEVQIETKMPLRTMSRIECDRIKKIVAERLRSVIGLRVKITLLSPKSLERTQGKSRRVVDLR